MIDSLSIVCLLDSLIEMPSRFRLIQHLLNPHSPITAAAGPSDDLSNSLAEHRSSQRPGNRDAVRRASGPVRVSEAKGHWSARIQAPKDHQRVHRDHVRRDILRTYDAGAAHALAKRGELLRIQVSSTRRVI